MDIQVRFESGDGIQANKTEVLYKGISVGKVTDLHVSKDIKGVVATIEIKKEAQEYLSKDTRFWLVKPRVSLAGVTGLEAGRGFAVVADEVRNLAHRAQESAQQIQKMIEELQIGAREAVATMTESQRYSLESVEIANRAGERLGSVTSRIGEIDSMNQSVATATEEQTAVVDSLNMDITEINTLNQEGVERIARQITFTQHR